MRSTGRADGIGRFFRLAALAVAVGATPSCGRPDPDAPPPSAARALAPAVATAPADPVRVAFVVPAFAQRFGQDALVDVTACRETVCASATVMLGDGFSTALPTTATAAEVTAQLMGDSGALKVTLQVPDPGPTGAGNARSLGLTVTPTPATAAPGGPTCRWCCRPAIQRPSTRRR